MSSGGYLTSSSSRRACSSSVHSLLNVDGFDTSRRLPRTTDASLSSCVRAGDGHLGAVNAKLKTKNITVTWSNQYFTSKTSTLQLTYFEHFVLNEIYSYSYFLQNLGHFDSAFGDVSRVDDRLPRCPWCHSSDWNWCEELQQLADGLASPSLSFVEFSVQNLSGLLTHHLWPFNYKNWTNHIQA